MTILLDTHTWLWMMLAPERLSAQAKAIVESSDDELLLSAASAWEIAIKFQTGKIKLPRKPESFVPEMMQETLVRPLAITHTHTLVAGGLPLHHRDPFDRLLIAQARLEDLPIITADPRFAPYGVRVIAA